MKKFVPATQDPTGLYQYQRPNDNNPTSFLDRLDQSIATRHLLSFRSFHTRKQAPLAAGNLPAFQTSRQVTDTDFIGTSYTWTLSPTKVNTLRYGFNATYSNQDLQPKITDDELRQLGWSSNYKRYNDNSPSMVVSGYFTVQPGVHYAARLRHP